MSKAWPKVVALKKAKSSGMRQGSLLWKPMPRLRATAAMAMRGRPENTRLDGDWCFDARMWIVTFDGDVLELEGKEVFHFRIEDESGQGAGLPGEL